MELVPWKKVMSLRSDVISGRLTKESFAANLDEVASGGGQKEYKDPIEFFNRTYLTLGLKDLLCVALRRISGNGGSSVVQIRTAFGGGKTHSMLALYHLLTAGVPKEGLRGVSEVLDKACVSKVPEANVVVIVGTSYSTQGRKIESGILQGTHIRTLWGEIAYELSKAKNDPSLFDIVRAEDMARESPGEKKLKELFDRASPCVILMDEIVAYARKLDKKEDGGTFENFLSFIQELTQGIARSSNGLLVVSVPESDIEAGGEKGRAVQNLIDHVFHRVENDWKPIQSEEGFEVVARRLFDSCINPAAKEETCNAYFQMYKAHKEEYPPECSDEAYRERLIKCYPIHPEVFDLLYKKWSTLTRFQRTRGVLRMMSALIYNLYKGDTKEGEMPLIMSSSVAFAVDAIREEFIKPLEGGNAWNPIIDTEVDGASSLPCKYDAASNVLFYNHYHRDITRAIMLGSAPISDNSTVRGVQKSRILLGVAFPGQDVCQYNDALEKLRDELLYLYASSKGEDDATVHFWFDCHPTLRKTLLQIKASITDNEVTQEFIKKERALQKDCNKGLFSQVCVCIDSLSDIRVTPHTLTLVLLMPDDSYSVGQRGGSGAFKKVNCLLSEVRGNATDYPNSLLFLACDEGKLKILKDCIREKLAYEKIQVLSKSYDKERSLNLDNMQNAQVRKGLKEASDKVESKIRDVYCHLINLLEKAPQGSSPNKLEVYTLEDKDDGSSLAKRVTEFATKEGIAIGEGEYAPSPLELSLKRYYFRDDTPKYKKIKDLVDDFFRYPILPKVQNESTVLKCIEKGAREGLFAVALSCDKAIDYESLMIDNDGAYIACNITDNYYIVEKTYALNWRKDYPLPKPKEPEPVDDPNHDHKPGGGNPGGGGTPEKEEEEKKEEPRPTHYFLDVDLPQERAVKIVSSCVRGIAALLLDSGGKVKLTLTLEGDCPAGFDSSTVSNVKENQNNLNLKDGFDERDTSL